MHNFYEVLLKRFRRVGAQTAKLSRERQDREKQLNFLTGWAKAEELFEKSNASS